MLFLAVSRLVGSKRHCFLRCPGFPQWKHLGTTFFERETDKALDELLTRLSLSFCFLSSCRRRSVTTSIFGTSELASRAVTSMLYESGKLANKWTTLSSSSTGDPITASSSKISVSCRMCSCTDSPSLSLREYSLFRSCSLLAQVFFWNWSDSFLQTATGSSGSPTKYSNEGSTDRTMSATARSFRAANFASFSSSSPLGACSVPLTIDQRPSFNSTMRHCSFHVG